MKLRTSVTPRERSCNAVGANGARSISGSEKSRSRRYSSLKQKKQVTMCVRVCASVDRGFRLFPKRKEKINKYKEDRISGSDKSRSRRYSSQKQETRNTVCQSKCVCLIEGVDSFFFHVEFNKYKEDIISGSDKSRSRRYSSLPQKGNKKRINWFSKRLSNSSFSFL